MKILVFGAGALGSAFGGFLSEDGHDVTLYGRKWHLSKVQKSGLKVEGIFGEHCFRNLKVETSLSKLKKRKGEFDLILLPVKSFDTKRAAKEIKSLITSKTIILSLQNGLGNIETLHHYFPKKQVLAARVIFGVELMPGEINITVWGGNVLVGETHQKKISNRTKQIAAIFSKSGIKSEAVSDIQKWLWLKVIYNSSLNPLASLLKTHYGSLLEKEYTRDIMKAIVRECYLVAEACRVDLKPKTAEGYIKLLFGTLIPDTHHHHPSMLQDLKRGKKTEIDYMNGAMVRMGKEKQISVPVNRLLVRLIKAKEN